jgi:hypothetical protein
VRLRRSFVFLRRLGLVTFGAGEIEDEGLRLVFQFFLFEYDGVGMKELGGDVGEDRGAARRDAAFGHQDEEASEIFAQVFSRRELEWAVEKVFREVGEVIGHGSEGKTSGDLAIIVAKAKARLGREAGKSAASAVGVAVVTAGRIVGALGGVWRRHRRDRGCGGLGNFRVRGRVWCF